MNSPAAQVRVVASAESWIEGDALQQLEAVARLPGVELAVGMPDLHPGKGAPIGAAFLTRGVLYPHLVGSDVGCGMSLWRTGLKSRKAKRDRWVRQLHGLESPEEGREGPAALGTIGGGNHFAELQRVEAVHDEATFEAMGLKAGELVLLVHSGSRGMGEALLRRHTDRFGATGLEDGRDEAKAYLRDHAEALRWARANRARIAERFLDCLGAQGTPTLDLCHNGLEARVGEPTRWLHRKGAAPADRGPVVIPGSRGAPTHLVLPTPKAAEGICSLAHGAGRKWKRSFARERIRERFPLASLETTPFGGRVICADRDLLCEEAPAAYKDVEQVVQDLVDAGLAKPVATFVPLITYKTRARG
jgi:release factor H-coupled RctB family protein